LATATRARPSKAQNETNKDNYNTLSAKLQGEKTRERLYNLATTQKNKREAA